MKLRRNYWKVCLHLEDKRRVPNYELPPRAVGCGSLKLCFFDSAMLRQHSKELWKPTVLGGLFPEVCMVCLDLDDIIITGKIFKKYLVNLKTVFCRLRTGGLKLTPKKYKLFHKIKRPVISCMSFLLTEQRRIPIRYDPSQHSRCRKT